MRERRVEGFVPSRSAAPSVPAMRLPPAANAATMLSRAIPTTAVDVAAGTLYGHFPSKADLFAEVFRVVSQCELAAMRAPEAGERALAFDTVLVTSARQALHKRRLASALVYVSRSTPWSTPSGLPTGGSTVPEWPP